MNWVVIPVSNNDHWDTTLRRLGCDDPYFVSSYHEAYAYDGGKAFMYHYRDDSGEMVYPIRLRGVPVVGNETIEGFMTDLETVYGYTGPFATSSDPAFLARAWAGFGTWVTDQHVVCEFCRFHPLLATNRFAATGMTLILDRDTVAINLGCGEESLWTQYESVQRNRVRKARSHGLSCRQFTLEEGLPVFIKIYEDTMNLVGASEFYHFPEEYYSSLSKMQDMIAIFVVLKDDVPIASAIFLVGATAVYYHLGGSLAAYRKLSPNNILFHSVALWSLNRGAKHLFLGGGRTNAADDNLLRFKRRFSRDTVPFIIGKKIWNSAAYERLSLSWRKQNSTVPPPVLQHYRLPIEEDAGGH